MMRMMLRRSLSGILDEMSVVMEQTVKIPELIRGIAFDILPRVIGKVAGCMVETVILVGGFNIDFYAPVRQQFGVDDLCIIVERHKRIHHS